jgi:DNA polymerase III epsilon subunit-like protein
MRVLVFDTETTGLPEGYPSFYDTAKWPHVVQLSYSLYDCTLEKIIIENDHIISVGNDVVITPKSIEMHKITKEISQNKGIPIERALESFNVCLECADVIMAHNYSFDKRMLIVEHIRSANRAQNIRNYALKDKKQLFPSYKREFCTMRESKDLCNIKAISSKDGEEYIKFPTLSELHQKLFGVLPDQTAIHNSLIDVRLCLKCGLDLLRRIK